MTNNFKRLAMIAVSGAAFMALTGCGVASPDDGYQGPPAGAYDRGDAGAPDLMGAGPAPRASDGTGLLGGPAAEATMAPIPNPGDLSKADRVRFYGHKYDHLPEPKAGRRAAAPSAAPGYQLMSRRKADGTLEVSMRPIANPEDMTPAERRRIYGYRYAPRAETSQTPRRSWRPAAAPKPKPAVVAAKPAPAVKPASKPVVVAPPKPVAAAPVIKPVAPLKPATPPPAVAVAPKATPAQQLSAAVRPEVMQGAVLTVPETVTKGQEGKVSLSLPASLMDVIKREAAKLGFGKAAKKAEVSATLTGEGYEITPNAAQTQKLKAGEAARFDWNVKPGAGEKAPLKATVDGTLTGDRKSKTSFSLGTLEQAVAAPVAEVKKAAKGFKLPSFDFPKLSLKALSIPGVPTVDLPVLGKTSSDKLVGAGIALLALLLVIGMARGAAANRARAERRRKFRTMTDYGRAEPEAEPAPAKAPEPHVEHQSYVNPMLAAAAGAAVGAAATHVAHETHDAHEAHAAPEAHEAHPAPEPHAEPVSHETHAVADHHEAPVAHDDHGHAPEAHAAPEVHAAEDHGHEGHAHDHREPEHA